MVVVLLDPLQGPFRVAFSPLSPRLLQCLTFKDNYAGLSSNVQVQGRGFSLCAYHLPLKTQVFVTEFGLGTLQIWKFILKDFPPLSQPSIVQISLSGWLVSLDKTSCVYTGQLGHCMYIFFLCTCHFSQALHLILYLFQ